MAEKLGLEKNTIYRWLQDGTLPGLQIGRKWLISESELGQFLEQQTRVQTRVRRIQASSKAAAAKVMDLAYEEAKRYRHTFVGQEHILLALAQIGESVATALEACGGTVHSIRDEFEQLLTPGEIEPTGKFELTPRAKKVVDAAEKAAATRGDRSTPEDLLAAMLDSGEGMGIEILTRLGIEEELLKPHLV